MRAPSAAVVAVRRCAAMRVPCVLLLCILLSWTGAKGGEDVDGMGIAELARVMRTRRPTPDLTAALRRLGVRARFAKIHAAEQSEGAEFLNVLEHTVELGWLSAREWRALGRWTRRAACLEVTVDGVMRRDVESGLPWGTEWSMFTSIQRVHQRPITLAPCDTPVVIEMFSAPTDQDGALRQFLGKRYVMSVVRAPTGLQCSLRAYWAVTGREAEVFAKVEPLIALEPSKMLEDMGAADPVRRWLGTAQAVMSCRSLQGGLWEDWPSPAVLSPEGMDKCRCKVQSALASSLVPLVWDYDSDALVAVAKSPADDLR